MPVETFLGVPTPLASVKGFHLHRPWWGLAVSFHLHTRGKQARRPVGHHHEVREVFTARPPQPLLVQL